MISFPPWKFSRQGSNLCLSFYFASEFVTQFMKLLLDTDHEYDVSGRSSQCGKNDLAGQSSWWVAVFVNHSFCCVHRAVLSWKRWVFFFFSTLIQLRLSIISLVWVPHRIVSRASDPPKEWCLLIFSVIEADFLPYSSYSHFAAGSPSKTQGTSHLLGACDIPRAASCGGRRRAGPRPAQSENTQADLRWRTTVFPGREWVALAHSGNMTEWQNDFYYWQWEGSSVRTSLRLE